MIIFYSSDSQQFLIYIFKYYSHLSFEFIWHRKVMFNFFINIYKLYLEFIHNGHYK